MNILSGQTFTCRVELSNANGPGHLSSGHNESFFSGALAPQEGAGSQHIGEVFLFKCLSI
jgi:hypothetical protein